MIVIYINGEGTAEKLSPQHVYQGSNQSGVLVFAPTPPQTEVGIAFKLPDGTSTPYYHMTYQGNYEGLSQYEFTLPSSITQLSGHAAIALQAIYSDGQRTSQLIDFEIEESVVVLPPELPPNVYDLLRQAIAKNTSDISGIQGQIDKIEDLAQKAEQASVDAVETANQAKETADGLADSIAKANATAQEAVETVNGAVNDIEQYKNETDNEIESFKNTVNGQIADIESTVNSAVNTANDAKSTADGLASSIAQANATASEAKEIAEEALEQSKVTGTKVNIAGEFATEVNFDSDPQTQLNDKVNKSGDTMTGPLSINNGYDLSGLKRFVVDGSALAGDTWYPITIKVPTDRIATIECFANFGGASGVVSWSTHESKTISYKAKWTVQGGGYGANYITRMIYDYCWRWGDNVFGYIAQMENSSNEYIYVRGGAKYVFYVSEGVEQPVIRTSAFTASSQTVSPTTTYIPFVPSNSFCSMQAIYENTKRVLSVNTTQLEPTTANGWTIGGPNLVINSDGVYLAQCKYDNKWSNCGIMIRANNNTGSNDALFSAMPISNNFKADFYQLTYTFAKLLNATVWTLVGENKSDLPTQVAYKKIA